MEMEAAAKLKLIMMMPLIISLLFFLMPLLISTTAQADDEGVNYTVKVDRVDISPDPVLIGANATFHVSASTRKVITGGLVLGEIYIERTPTMMIPLRRRLRIIPRDICDETTICPVAVGNFVFSHNETFRTYYPSNKLGLEITDEETNSFSFVFDIVPPPISVSYT